MSTISDKQRLDAFLQQKYPQYSRSLLQKMIKNGHVTIDEEVATTSRQPVRGGQRVELDTSALSNNDDTVLELPVLYEDSDCVVIHKPLGVLCHSKGAYNPEQTVATWLRMRDDFNFPADNERAGIVHRLDRATSGVMICAKNRVALGKLQKQFQLRKAKKTYTARVVGVLEPEHAIIDVPIERNPKKPQTFRVGSNGKTAQTEYQMLQTFAGGDSLVELKPVTGRTHQLRVHLHYIQHPIIGDVLYEGRAASRLYLHATSLEITLPNSTRETFSVDVPAEFYGDAV